jgi:hypothetical protein
MSKLTPAGKLWLPYAAALVIIGGAMMWGALGAVIALCAAALLSYVGATFAELILIAHLRADLEQRRWNREAAKLRIS